MEWKGYMLPSEYHAGYGESGVEGVRCGCTRVMSIPEWMSHSYEVLFA